MGQQMKIDEKIILRKAETGRIGIAAETPDERQA
jgi:hypothetical protein